MIQIEVLAAGSLSEAGAVLDAAFGRWGMEHGLRRNRALQPENWFCARYDGALAGVVGAFDYGPFAYVGMMGVHPGAQGRGVGRALMSHLVAHLEETGCPQVLLDASAAGRRLYPGLGFVADGETWRMQRDPGPALPMPARDPCAALEPFTEHDLPDVVAFDAPCFGAARPAVLAAFLAGAGPRRAYLARAAEGRCVGYLIADERRIGPWAAASTGVAAQLLDAALALPFPSGPTLTIPAANRAGLDLLAARAFRCVERLLHMRRDGARSGERLPDVRRAGAGPRQPALLYAQASLTLG